MHSARHTGRGSPAYRPAHPRAFTLVEVLVVIGIIAVLMGILVPSLIAAHAQSQAVLCLSNVRQIGSAALMYAQENNRYVTFIPGPPGVRKDRKELLFPYLSQGRSNADTSELDVWYCPGNKRVATEASYGFNTKLNNAKLARIKNPAETVALCDAGLADMPLGGPSLATHCWTPGQKSSPTSCRPNHKRHPKGYVSVAFIDGHAERLPMIAPFYPGPAGTYTPNGLTDRHNPAYQDALWDLD